MTTKRIVPSVRNVARRVAHLLRGEPEALDYDGRPVLTLHVREGFFRSRQWNKASGWDVYWERGPLNYAREWRTAYATVSLPEGGNWSADSIARELLRDVRWDAEHRQTWTVTQVET